MAEKRLVIQMRVSKWWKKQDANSDAISNLVWLLYDIYTAYGFKDKSAALVWEIRDSEPDEEGEENKPYLYIWEVIETIDADGKPIPDYEEGNKEEEDQNPDPKPPEDSTGKPAFTSDDLNKEIQND